jgi:hypothetical protein
VRPLARASAARIGRRRSLAPAPLLATGLLIAACGSSSVASSVAASGPEATFTDNVRLLADPAGTLDTLRRLGVDRVRVFVPWASIAPRASSRQRPRGLDATNPDDYPPANWVVWDRIVSEASARGIGLDFNLGPGAPLWATGPGDPRGGPHPQWQPSAHQFGSFVRAIARRYDGTFTPPGATSALPRVDYWAIWNEPNYGPDLAPQATHGSTVETAASIYRGLVDAAWTALQVTGHGHDTVLIGEVAARGVDGRPSRGAPEGFPGNFAGTKPLRFVRALYCVDGKYRQYRGAAAALRGCPTTAASSRGFRAAHPALFQASGFADHPYSQASPPNVEPIPDPDFTSLAQLPQLERILDRLQRIYGSTAHPSIYLTEYGYITRPPKRSFYLTPSTAAYYLNWAEYLTWRDPRVQTITQYLLVDPPPVGQYAYGGFASGLISYDGHVKATYDAYRLPLYLPATSARAGQRLEVWGCVRPARYAAMDTGGAGQQASVQFRRGSAGTWQTLQTVTVTGAHGYFDVRTPFPASGSVRIKWTYPSGQNAYSRIENVTVR